MVAKQYCFLILCFYEAQTRLAYLFEDNVGAVEAGEKGWEYRQAAMGTLYVSEHNFYYSLALLAEGQLTPENSDRLAANQAQLKIWSEFSPSNFQHKYDLIEAEHHRILGKFMGAMEFYDRAIAGAKKNKYLQEEALANELTAKFYLNWGKDKIAAVYMQEAYYCYARWGAKAKVEHLEQKYPQLLATILKNNNLTIANSANITSISTGTLSRTSSNQNLWLDFPSVMKAAQAISQEIELEKLLTTLMEIAIANAGAQSGHLILCRDNKWLVVGRVQSKTDQEITFQQQVYQEWVYQEQKNDKKRTQTLEIPCLSNNKRHKYI